MDVTRRSGAPGTALPLSGMTMCGHCGSLVSISRFALRSEVDLSYLTYYASYLLAAGQVEVDQGGSF